MFFFLSVSWLDSSIDRCVYSIGVCSLLGARVLEGQEAGRVAAEEHQQVQAETARVVPLQAPSRWATKRLHRPSPSEAAEAALLQVCRLVQGVP